ncbi:MAG TPA: gamma-glutamylcyclotransferase family protein [Candidatus Saccharimonadales bacterium]|nr:gamma-glutamylcyclotransferase family protein [Candidatus Saccharimonadales bacterium]
MDISFLAFYGTLRHGHHTPVDRQTAAGLHYMGPCIIPGALYDRGRLKVLVPGDGQVAGELYAIANPAVLKVLDNYEAIDNEDTSLPGFSRKATRLFDPELSAWVYWYDGSTNGLKRLA